MNDQSISKRRFFSKAALLALASSSMLAISRATAQATVVFESVIFFSNAPSATTKRTVAARWGDTINVKDYGAVGDNVTDDTAAFQRAIDARAKILGIIIIPPGTYKITGTLNLPTAGAESSFIIKGCGQLSKIVASGFSGFVFQRAIAGSSNGALFSITDMTIQTTSATISGIKLVEAQVGNIERITFQGCHIGIHISVSCFHITIRDCDFRGRTTPPDAGSVAILNGCTAAEITGGAGPSQGISALNINITNFENGIRWGAPGGVIGPLRTEECDIGVVLGKNPDYLDAAASGVVMNSCAGEACGVGLYVYHASNCVIHWSHTGDNLDAAGRAEYSTYGTKILFATACAFQIGGGGYYSVATLGVESGGNAVDCTFSNCFVSVAGGGGAAWVMPVNRASVAYINCNNPTAAMAFTYLPGQVSSNIATPIEGMQFDITDSNTATWGAIAASGGANHVRVRYNGTNWTVMGA